MISLNKRTLGFLAVSLVLMLTVAPSVMATTADNISADMEELTDTLMALIIAIIPLVFILGVLSWVIVKARFHD